MTGKVVVNFVPEILVRKDELAHAARIRGLGITAYGDSKEGALARMEKMFRSFVNWHREHGDLEEVLNRSGLEWAWEENYAGAVPVKDVSVCEAPVNGVVPTAHPLLWDADSLPEKIIEALAA